mgnify:CR=1 FL=1
MTIGDSDDVNDAANQLYVDLCNAGIEVLDDDRNERSIDALHVALVPTPVTMPMK